MEDLVQNLGKTNAETTTGERSKKNDRSTNAVWGPEFVHTYYRLGILCSGCRQAKLPELLPRLWRKAVEP